MTLHTARRGRTRTWPLVTGLAAATALTWLAWLGWDQDRQLDPATGASSGPYETWQVLGCATTLAALALAAGLLRRPGVAIAVIPLVFAAAWSAEAARSDQSGLWPIGAVLVLAGTLAGVAAVAYLASTRGRAAGAHGAR